MFLKFLFSIILFAGSLFAEVLDVSKAFVLTPSVDSQNVEVKFNFGENIYLYKESFEIKLAGKKINELLNLPSSENTGEYEIYPKDFSIFIPLNLVKENLSNGKAILDINYQGCAKNGICYRPQSRIYEITDQAGKFSIATFKKEQKSDTDILAEEFSSEQDIANGLGDKNFFISLLTFFGYGLLLSLTPCVFPMIPILSSIIVSKGANLNAKKGFLLSFIYVVAMSLAYALAGVAASLLGFGIAGALQNIYVLGAFAAIFVILSFSMFGFYDIKLPAKFENLISKKSQNSSGYVGIFIMGFASALIVSPCVAAPLAGALLYIAQSGNIFYGGIMLFVMGLGMGVPLLIIGLSSGKLLPKPGSWMDEVKKFFGFLMLIMAVWILARVLGEFFELLGYGIIGIFMAVYFGAFEVAEQSWTKFKKAFFILVFIYSVMLIVGSFLGSKEAFSPLSGLNLAKSDSALKFNSVKNLYELNEVIKNSTKPVLVDFYADWCASCKEIEKITFKDSDVIDALANFALIRIDVTNGGSQNDEMLRNFGLIDPPALLLFNGGNELKFLRTIGFIDAKNFLAKLEKIK
ncbi:cytochrome C biogenesis protein [Campylobacter concisus]|uniref:protein-disulfide reductase DsbD n=1 Tax=Campylobacter concisus TaxID=199 RepID=UPI000B3D6902|nr:protein-disulfide reductase DsbD [Campylobacter concisus]OUT13693.1 cytochrome C biogenesis protein [Campylobacter concisus]